MPDPCPHPDRVARLIRLLGSDKDGEVLAAVAALKRTLEGAGHDLHHLAALIEHSQTPTMIERTIVRRDDAPRDIAYACTQHRNYYSLKPHEQRFINEMAWRRGDPTERQLSWLIVLHDKLERV